MPPDNSSFAVAAGPRPELTAGERWWLHRLAREELGNAPRPALTAGALWPAVTLPWWALRNALRLRRGVKGSLVGYARRLLGR